MKQRIITSGSQVTNLVVSTFPIKVMEIFGYWNGAADTFLQLHETATLPANGQVPVYASLRLFAQDGFKFPFPQGLDLSKLVAVFSSTEETLTIEAGAGNEGDITVVREEYELQPDGLTTVTSAGNSDGDVVEIWAHAAGPKRLVSMEVTISGTVQDSYIQLYARNAATTRLNIGPFLAKAGGSLTLNFGVNGREIFKQLANLPYQGCAMTVLGSIDSLEGSVPWTGSFDVVAKYK